MTPAPKCLECDGYGRKVSGDKIYPHRQDLHSFVFWRCDCGAYTGSHKNSPSNAPKGLCAGPETRRARIDAHKAFDAIYRDKSLSRSDAYKWLADKMGITRKQCHIGYMNREQAERVALLSKERLNK